MKHYTMYGRIFTLTMSLGLVPLVTSDSRGPIGPKLCVELCNQRGICKAAFYDSQNLVCHFEEPKSSGVMEHITQLMAQRTEAWQNGVLIQTRHKGARVIPVTAKAPAGHGHALTEDELNDRGYREEVFRPHEWLKVYTNSQTWPNALAHCTADGTSLLKVDSNVFEVCMEIQSLHISRRNDDTCSYIWVGLRYSQDRRKLYGWTEQ
ncbi:uncharacterized protein [Haliotis asinina]|uniref:uncharacterized protein n=1 Tax=Haliotis asinina TaxID=109174 RepID=UPI0035322779